MGNKWSAKRHGTTAATDSSQSKAQTGWNDLHKKSNSLSESAAVNNLSQLHTAQTPKTADDQHLLLANDIILYRSYSNMPTKEAEMELLSSQSSSAGVRFDSALCRSQRK